MIKVTLLGDSIRLLGYGKLVPEILGNEYEVYQPEDNCRFAKYTLRGLFDWKKDMAGSRIVHWNNGAWDVCNLFDDGPFTNEEEYVTNILRIADILLSNYEKVIFATTTPIIEKTEHNINSVTERYNNRVVPLLKEKGVIINDLYSTISRDTERYIKQNDYIHLNEEGAVVCAKQVADIIKSVAETLDASKEKSDYESDLELTGLPV